MPKRRRFLRRHVRSPSSWGTHPQSPMPSAISAVVAYGQGTCRERRQRERKRCTSRAARGDTWAAGVALRCLALTACERGDFAGAASHLADALAVDLAQGNRDSHRAPLRLLCVRGGRARADGLGFPPARRVRGPARGRRRALALPERATYERAGIAARECARRRRVRFGLGDRPGALAGGDRGRGPRCGGRGYHP